LSAVSTYAEALFGAARDQGELEEVLSDLGGFVEAMLGSEELRLFFFGGQIPERQKRKALDGLTEGMKTTTTNFLKVLVDNGREEILEEVLARYEELVKEHLGRIEVKVTTAVDLSDEQLDRLKERLGAVLEGREIILENNVDPELVGGAVFRYGGRLMDGSIRGRLESLREGMLERSVI
jgi:F-type H+-transporting ATPase subunit delta